MVASATAVSGFEVPHHKGYRPLGQLIVATAVGLYFTPEAFQQTIDHFVSMVIAAVLTIGAGFRTAIVLYRLTKCDGTVAFFASMPGGPAEMAVLAERWGAPPAPVVLGQTLRIVFIVLLIPVGLALFAGLDVPVVRPAAAVDPVGLVMLYAIAAGGTVFLRRLKVPNCNFLGPLAVAALISVSGLELSGVPKPLLAGGQVLLGISLGANFRREQFARDLKFSIALVATTVVLLVQCAAVAAGLWLVDSGPSLASYLLATAPGSVTEMALTAKLLGQRVALVTAYHLVRIFIIIPLAPVLYRAFRRALSGRMTFDNLMD